MKLKVLKGKNNKKIQNKSGQSWISSAGAEVWCYASLTCQLHQWWCNGIEQWYHRLQHLCICPIVCLWSFWRKRFSKWDRILDLGYVCISDLTIAPGVMGQSSDSIAFSDWNSGFFAWPHLLVLLSTQFSASELCTCANLWHNFRLKFCHRHVHFFLTFMQNSLILNFCSWKWTCWAQYRKNQGCWYLMEDQNGDFYLKNLIHLKWHNRSWSWYLIYISKTWWYIYLTPKTAHTEHNSLDWKN